MLNQLPLVLVLLGIASALNCQYQTDSSCTAAGCSWTANQTCVVGNGNCQDNQAYYQNECVTCSSLSNNNCSAICTQYYFSTSLGCASCTNINSKCLTCSPSQCYTCSTGFSVDPAYKTECLIDKCRIRYCQQCDSNSTCYLCSSGYTPGLNQTYCSISSCKVSNCLYCSNDNTCITCVSGYLLSQDSATCTLICNDPYCSACLTYSTCTACKSGYEFSKITGYCILSCDVPYCSTCDLSTTCTGCNTGYKLNTDRTLCFLKCSDSNCVSCSDPTVCKTCAIGYTLLSNGTCDKAICYISSCLVCNNSLTCAVCSSISQLQATRQQCRQNCLKESYNSKCKTCKDNTTCQTCTAGYSLNQTTSLCYPVCNIDFCVTCLSSKLCSFCSGQYSPSSDGTKCEYNCGILNCQICNSSKTCQACNGVYSLSATASSCDLVCTPGSYPDLSNAACKTCTSAILNCATCFSSNSTLVCSACYDLYYLTSNGVCKLCSNVLSNCLLCLNPTSCISCASGFNLVYLNSQYQCVLPYSCNVSNCMMCNSNNASICTTCENGYYLTNSNFNCSLITCVQTQFYDPESGTCKCRVGTYILNNVCTYCNLDNCLSCNNGGCITCKARYYANSGQCSSCMSFCINCTTDKTCLECDYGFEYQDGACVSKQKKNGNTKIKSNGTNATTTVVICPPGCEKCIYYLEKIYCTSTMSGYAIDSNGDIVRCSDECATCASLDYKICTSCYGASVLKQGTCVGCSDAYALTCPKNVNYATTCQVGYTSKAGKCQKCADNCLLCTVTGPSQCDSDGCVTGYVNILYTTTCTKCYASCATCLRYNPGVCLTCGPANYLSTNSSTCVGCPSNCLTCTSSTVCTSCPSNYILEQLWCYPNIGYPCATQSKSICTSCYLGYSLISGVCQTDDSCNATATCLTCPKNSYLNNRRCFPCSITTNCDYCQPTAPTICLQCSSGYYLAKSNSSCTSCPTGCAQCLSAKKCIVAQNGYYLQIDSEGGYTGKTAKCDASCATCSFINSCDTCADNYQKLGVSCIYYRYLQALLVLGPVASNGSSSWFQDGNQKTYTQAYAYLNTLQIITAIASSTNTPTKKITISSVTVGSIVVNAIVQSDQTQDFTSFSDNFEQSISTMTQFTLLSQSVVINGQESSNNGANLGVLLGVTVPLIVLLMIIIIAVKMRLDDESDEKETGQTEKQIQQFEM